MDIFRRVPAILLRMGRFDHGNIVIAQILRIFNMPEKALLQEEVVSFGIDHLFLGNRQHRTFVLIPGPNRAERIIRLPSCGNIDVIPVRVIDHPFDRIGVIHHLVVMAFHQAVPMGELTVFIQLHLGNGGEAVRILLIHQIHRTSRC